MNELPDRESIGREIVLEPLEDGRQTESLRLGFDAVLGGVSEELSTLFWQLNVQAIAQISFGAEWGAGTCVANQGEMKARLDLLGPEKAVFHVLQGHHLAPKSAHFWPPGTAEKAADLFIGSNRVVVSDEFAGRGVVEVEEEGDLRGFGPFVELVPIQGFVPYVTKGCTPFAPGRGSGVSGRGLKGEVVVVA